MFKTEIICLQTLDWITADDIMQGNIMYLGFPDGAVVKNLPVNAEEASDVGSIPGSGGAPGEGNGNPL